jgi:peptidoglycan/LPS O-acetylase OafA/YrhL
MGTGFAANGVLRIGVGHGTRLRWLDGLRGIAVLAVVIEHLTYLVFGGVRAAVITPWFDSGKFGVMVFFLVSGYIIPASLERHGSVRRFWTGRVFRLYPLLIVATGAVLLLTLVGLATLDGRVSGDWPTVVLAHLTMLQDVLGVQNFLNVLWTLSYEMLFYLLTTALFVLGAHRRTGALAVGFGVGAVVLAPVLPAVMLSTGGASTRWVVGSVIVLLALGLAGVMSGGRTARVAAACLLLVVVAGLLLLNQRAGMWEGMVIMAAMLTGTVLYRAEHGQVAKGRAAAVVGTVWAAALAAGIWNFRLWPHVHGVVERHFQQSWATAILATGLLFAVAWRLRHRGFPRPLVGLGVISYSVYLMHTVVLSVFHQLFDRQHDTLGLAGQGAIAVAYVLTMVTVAWATHRYVELPGQRLGRRLAAPRAAPAAAPAEALP